MQVSVESIGGLGRRLTVAIPAADVEKEIHARLQRLAKSVRLPGFRPGRAPMKVVEAKYGGQVLSEVAGNLIEQSLYEALGKEGLVPAGGPDIEPKTLERGKDLEYVASFDVYPEVTRTDLAGIAIERPLCQVEDADVERTIESMRKQRITWRPVERAAGQGDRLTINFRGTIDGQSFRGGDAENYNVVLGQGNLLQDFDDGLQGVTVGDTKEIDVRFPDDYHGTEVAGKQAKFAVEVTEVAEPVLPDLDAEFANSFGIEDGDLDTLRRDVRQNLQRELDERISKLLRERVFQALVEANAIDLPRKLVESEIDRMVDSSQAALRQQGIPTDPATADRAPFEGDARRRVALGLIVYEIVRKLDIKPDADRVRSRVASIAAGYEDPDAFVKWYLSDKQRVSQVESVVLEEQVVEEMLKTADITEKPVSFEELMQAR